MLGNERTEWLRFRPETNGTIDLSNVSRTSGRVYYDPEVPFFSLPALQSASSAWFQVSPLNTIDLPALENLNGCTLDIEDDGTINAPSLTAFANSSVTLKPNRFLLIPPLSEIDNSRIYLQDGAVFDRVSDSEYHWTNNWGNCLPPLSVIS